MLPSSSSEDFGLWGKIFRGYFAFTFVTARCLAHHPEDGFVDRLKRFGFPPPLYPSYEVLTFSSVGLTPTEHISLSPFSFLDMPELNTQPTYALVYASLCTSRCAAQNSGPGESLVLSRKTLAFSTSCRFIPAHKRTPFFQTIKVIAAIFRAKVRRAIVGRIPLASKAS